MKIISHRGNLYGPKSCLENNPFWIEKVIEMGYDVEIDLRYRDGFYLGHDSPQYKIDRDWLEKYSNNLWVHCKEKSALEMISSLPNINYFWHQSDDYTITSKGFFWIYPGMDPIKNGIYVLPEIAENVKIDECYAICTDFAERYKNA